jgi:hypothetical protein
MASTTAARTLGLASLGIGLTELAATRQVQRALGLDDRAERSGILRVLGARELMHGIDILSHANPTPGIWSRVAGDLLDGALLGAAAKKTRRPSSFAAIAAMVLGIAALDLYFAQRLTRSRQSSDGH